MLGHDVHADEALPGKPHQPGLQAGDQARQGMAPHDRYIEVHTVRLPHKGNLQYATRSAIQDEHIEVRIVRLPFR